MLLIKDCYYNFYLGFWTTIDWFLSSETTVWLLLGLLLFANEI